MRLETKGDFFLTVRVDPWECYQDTWQTTCSVLEHHRDLMKVSGASLRGGWAAEARRGRGKGAAGLQPQFRLWSLAIRGGEPHEGGRGTRNPESARGCSCLAPACGIWPGAVRLLPASSRWIEGDHR